MGGIINSARRSPPTRIWRGSARAEKAVWWVAVRKAGACCLEYIQDQLDTDLTVSGIAQAVGMSPDHFTRLFKESTGQSPHQYVVEARVRKAKELLTTGKFTISEAAFHVGFADQSHLTHHFKRVFGLPPKRLLSRRRPEIVV
jgi:AraC-like DNA-binding protein